MIAHSSVNLLLDDDHYCMCEYVVLYKKAIIYFIIFIVYIAYNGDVERDVPE